MQTLAEPLGTTQRTGLESGWHALVPVLVPQTTVEHELGTVQAWELSALAILRGVSECVAMQLAPYWCQVQRVEPFKN